tara:strand:+ start:49 stop:399 length:351 start_codon:yes stop_codon:yes gene_type:complete
VRELFSIVICIPLECSLLVVQLAALLHPKTDFLFQQEVPNCPRGTVGFEVVSTDIEKLLSARMSCGRKFDRARSRGQIQRFIIRGTAHINKLKQQHVPKNANTPHTEQVVGQQQSS